MSTGNPDAGHGKSASGAAGSAGRQGSVAGVVRTRFAPSPTGFMHVGGVRTALFAWLVARQAKGQFILRLEDTDQAREVAGSDQHIMDTLKWLGLSWDEGPDADGPHGPYRQSQRLEIYQKWAQKLIEARRAYADPFTEDELGDLRQKAKAAKKPFLFREHRPSQTPAWDGQRPLRFKSEPKDYRWQDEVMGELNSGPEAIDDFILIKSDGFPTYNFAHVVDDFEMAISHVIRSQEFLPSVPKYLNLYDALGLERPVLATLPFVLGPDGQKKLSKRDGGAKDVLDYAKDGYLPDAVLNYLASLGWNDGTEQEIFSREELIDKFDLKRVQKSGARFDPDKLAWLNWQHFKQSVEQDGLQKTLEKIQLPPQQTAKLTDLELDAAARLAASKAGNSDEFFEQLAIFTEPPAPLEQEVLKLLELGPGDAQHQRDLALEALEKLAEFAPQSIETALRGVMDEHQLQPRQFLNLVRWAVSGRQVSPSLFDMLAALGQKQTLARLQAAV